MSKGIVTGTNKLISRITTSPPPKPPYSELWPVTIDMLKEHIQVNHAYDDSILADLGGYLPGATEDVERRGNVALINQSRRQTIGEDVLLDGLKGKTIAITVGPVYELTQVKYIDLDGAPQVLDSSLYRLTESESLYFYDDPPELIDGPDSVFINYTAGFGESADEVPDMWRVLVMQIACRMYDFRGGDSGASNDSWERMMQRQIDIAGGSYRG